MARIQQIEARRGLEGGGVPSTQIDQSIGNALSGVGAALNARADSDARLQLRREQMAMENSQFQSEQDFQRFKQDIAAKEAETLVDIDPSGAGYAEKVAEAYETKAKEFLAKVPANLQPRLGDLLETHRNGVLNGAAAKEADRRNTWFKEGISKRADELVTGVIENPGAYEDSLSEGMRVIDSSGLPPVEKEALREGLKTALLLGKAENYKRTDPSRIIGPRVGPVSEKGTALKFRLMKDFGMTKAAAAAFAGNLHIESGGYKQLQEINPTVKGSRGGFGWSQWTGLRRKQFEAWAKSQGVDPSSDGANYGFLAYELQNTPEGRVLQKLKGVNDPQKAALIVSREFLRPGIPHENKRIAATMRYFDGTDVDPGGLDLSGEFAELPANAQLKLYDEAVAAEGRLMTAQAAEAKAQYEAMKDSLDLGIATGEISSRQSILESNLNDGDKAVMIRRLGEKSAEEAAIADLIGRISVGEGAAVNPYDTSSRGIADKAYDQIAKTVDPEMAGAAERAFVESTGYIPRQVVADLRNGAASDNAKSFGEAMQRADELDRFAPKALDAIDGASDVRKSLEQYRAKVERFGMSPEDAAKAVLDARKPENEVSREVLKVEAGKFLKELSASDVTNALDQGLFDREADLPLMPTQQNALMAEYREVAESAFYDTGGDPDAAKNIALADMKKRWGVSRVTGDKRVMRLPPENFYPVINGSHEYIREDALNSVKEWASEALPGVSVGNVSLVPDRATRADVEAGKPPRYRLFYSYQNDVGATVYDEVPDGYWQMNAETLKERTGAELGLMRSGFDELRNSAALAEDGGRAASQDAFLNGPLATPDNPGPSPDFKPSKTTAGGRIAEKLPITDPSIPELLNNGGGGGF